MTTASSLERTGDLSLYGMVGMATICGVLFILIVLALLDRGDDTAPAIAPFLRDARADQLARAAVLGTPTDEHPIVPQAFPARLTRMDVPPRGHGIAQPGRHRRAEPEPPRSLATMGLSEALARLAVDRVKRDAQRAEFQALLAA